VAAIVVAVLSRGGACWLGARLAGERGSVPARVGTRLVLVALVTTIMTAPVLSWIDRREVRTVPVTRISAELGEAAG
jgi:hypothetical protein